MMLNMLNEKVDYSKDPEAPISLGMKLLKKLEKEGWKGADVYDAIEEIIISSDVKYPKQMAMRLKRTLENYDMWEAPYKGLVNKIQKWQFVNENFASNRFDHDVYYDAYAAIDNLISRNEWTIKDIDEQLDGGDIWYRDVMDEMNIDMSSLTEQEDEMVCGYIIDAMQDYLYDAMHDNVHESVDLDDENLYYDRLNDPNGERVKYEIEIAPHCRNVVYKRLFSGDFIKNAKLEYEHPFEDYDADVIEISAPSGQYRNIEDALNRMLKNGVINDFDLVGSYEASDLNESVEDDNEIKYYYRPIDIKILMRQQKERQLSKYEYYVLEAAMWARARSNNYHGYAPELPAVKYENGKFYASTKQDGMTEVPFNYKVMTKEWLFKN